MTKQEWLNLIKFELRKLFPSPLVVLAAVGLWYTIMPVEHDSIPDYIKALIGYKGAHKPEEVIRIAQQELKWEEAQDASASDDISGTA